MPIKSPCGISPDIPGRISIAPKPHVDNNSQYSSSWYACILWAYWLTCRVSASITKKRIVAMLSKASQKFSCKTTCGCSENKPPNEENQEEIFSPICWIILNGWGSKSSQPPGLSAC